MTHPADDDAERARAAGMRYRASSDGRSAHELHKTAAVIITEPIFQQHPAD